MSVMPRKHFLPSINPQVAAKSGTQHVISGTSQPISGTSQTISDTSQATLRSHSVRPQHSRQHSVTGHDSQRLTPPDIRQLVTLVRKRGYFLDGRYSGNYSKHSTGTHSGQSLEAISETGWTQKGTDTGVSDSVELLVGWQSRKVPNEWKKRRNCCRSSTN